MIAFYMKDAGKPYKWYLSIVGLVPKLERCHRWGIVAAQRQPFHDAPRKFLGYTVTKPREARVWKDHMIWGLQASLRGIPASGTKS